MRTLAEGAPLPRRLIGNGRPTGSASVIQAASLVHCVIPRSRFSCARKRVAGREVSCAARVRAHDAPIQGDSDMATSKEIKTYQVRITSGDQSNNVCASILLLDAKMFAIGQPSFSGARDTLPGQ